MIVIPPLDVISNPLIFTSSTITEGDSEDPSVWSVVASYNEGDRVRVTSTHIIYEALQYVTGGSSPEVDVLEVTPKWVEVQYVNKWAMFDYTRNVSTVTRDYTIDSGIMTIILTPGTRVNCLFMLDLVNVKKVIVTATSMGNSVYSHTKDNLPSGINIRHVDLRDIPPITDLILTITLQTDGASNLSCKSMVMGMQTYIGDVQNTGLNVDTVNFSSITRDEFGIASLVPRRSVLKLQFNLFLPSKYASKLVNLRNSLNATPAVWYAFEHDSDTESPLEDYNDTLVVMGIYKLFTITLVSPLHMIINLELEEI